MSDSGDDDDDEKQRRSLAPVQPSEAPNERSSDPPPIVVIPGEQMALPVGLMMQRLEARSETFSGPLPSPQALADFERAVPGTAATIIRWAEDEALHRRKQDNRDGELIDHCMREQLRIQRIGMYCGLAVALGGFLLTGYLAAIGAHATAALVGTLDLLGLVSVFVYGRHTQAKRLEAAQQNVPKPKGRKKLPAAKPPAK